MQTKDMEHGSAVADLQLPDRIPYWRMVFDRARVTKQVYHHQYEGRGTPEDPFIVTWMHNDPGNPMHLGTSVKIMSAGLAAIATLAVALNSSAFSGALTQYIEDFEVSTFVATLGVSLFVLGFAVGPLFWSPLSEIYGRQLVYFLSYGSFTVFNAAAIGSKNIETLLVLRFLAGAFGSAPLTIGGGSISDLFKASERGLAMSAFALAPFLGPTLGPFTGGFLGSAAGWKWVQGFLAIFSGVLWLLVSFGVPETFHPVLLAARAKKMSRLTGKVYTTELAIRNKDLTAWKIWSTSLSRPLVLLVCEPIVLALSIYLAIIYGTLYMLFGAYPIVFQEYRGWSQGIGGLAFLGVAVGMIAAFFTSLPFNIAYQRRAAKAPFGILPPEQRLPVAMLGAISIPIGIFWFAWTCGPSVHWLASVAAGAPFGFGMVLVFVAVMNYLVDSYTIYAASVLAANSVLRSIFGFAFPLFTKPMYDNLGIHWASTIPAFLALACVPLPFLFFRFGPAIRERCTFAKESQGFVQEQIARAQKTRELLEEHHDSNKESTDELEEEKEEVGLESAYEPSPYDIDRVNTQNSRIAHVLSRQSKP